MADVLPSGELVEEPSDYGSMQPGTRLGRYELLVPVARGGMARVWAARQHGMRGFQKLVAIKTILPHLAEEPEFERMFLDEARIASGVHHANVCEIYELGEENKTLYLVMEWVSGDSLARMVRSSGKTEALDPRVVSRIIADACAGLHAAHELTDEDGRALGVVHRDLSPHNILLTADGTAKVCDFGVAKALGQLHEATSAGQLKGKIAYMAPEQVIGSGVDRRSDVFSLGCVLYEATTGQRPFRGDGDHQVMHAVLKGEFPPPSSLVRNYPPELERIVVRALSQQPILRFPTAERMRFALEEFVARGQLVTQANVAQLMRQRIGEQIEKRKERIRQASNVGDRETGWSEPPGGMTPSNKGQEHISGVKPSGAHAAKPLFTTMAMDRPAAATALGIHGPGDAPPQAQVAPGQMQMQRPAAGGTMPPAAMGPLPTSAMQGPASSTTIPQAVPRFPPTAPGHTPVSHPGAGYSRPGQGGPQAGQAGHPSGSYDFANAATAVMPSPLEAQNMPPPPPANVYPQQPFTMPPSSGPPQPMQQQQQQFSYGPSSHGYPPSMSPAPPSYDPNPPASDGRASTPPAGAGQYAVAIGIGVLFAAMIGVGIFFVLRGRSAQPQAHDPPPVGTVATIAPSSSSPAGSGGATSSSPSTPTASPEIVFRLVPEGATLSVDGKDLAPDVRTLPRPAMGKTVTVVARAKGHDETTLLVDFFTTSPMDLTLKSSGSPAAEADPVASADPVPDPPKKKKVIPKGDPLPPNPF